MYIHGEQIFKKLKIHVGLWLENQKTWKPLSYYHNKQTNHPQQWKMKLEMSLKKDYTYPSTEGRTPNLILQITETQ